MSTRRFLLAVLSSIAWTTPLSSALSQTLDVGVPVPVFDELGVARHQELVQVLVPFSEADAILATDEVLLQDDSESEAPVQWRIMQRWHGGPAATGQPIRFALAQFQATIKAGETHTFLLRRRLSSDGPPAGSASPIIASIVNGVITVDTGPIRVGLDPWRGQLFSFVDADLNADGTIGADEQVIDDGSFGAMLVDVKDGVYLGFLDSNADWVVEELGPLKLVLRADGLHLPNIGGIGRDYFGYSTRYTFEAGSAAVRVEHILKNTYLTNPLGAMTFARYLLHARLAGDAPLRATFGTEEGGGKPISVELASMESAFLYQDSSGKSKWDQPGTTFQGFRVYHGGPFNQPVRPENLPTDPPLQSGLHAAGWMDVEDGERGVLVALRYPWQNYPFALRAYQTRDIVADLWPSEFAGTHWLDDATRKAHHLIYRFHGRSIDAGTEALRLTRPLVPVIDLTYLRASKAWADQGDLRDPKLPFWQTQQYGKQKLGEFYIYANVTGGFGWDNFGEKANAKNTHSTGSPRNKLSYFERYMASGARPWFEVQEAFALHSMDLRTYHIDGFTQAAFPGAHLVEGIPHYTGSDQLGRDQISPTLDPYKVGIPVGGKGWNGYDTEHMSVDDLYEYYLLTGSYSAMDAMVKIGEGMKTWHIINPNKAIVSSRAIGWSLRALMKIYQVTGDPVLLGKAKDIMQIVHTFRGHGSIAENGNAYFYLARNIYGGGTHGMTEDYDLPWQIAAGMYGIALYYRETLDPSVPPVLDDLARYITEFGVSNGVVVDALACDDHEDYNPKTKNDGVNAWIPSALAITYRLTGNPDALALAKVVFDENDDGFLKSPSYSWFHTVADVLGADDGVDTSSVGKDPSLVAPPPPPPPSEH